MLAIITITSFVVALHLSRKFSKNELDTVLKFLKNKSVPDFNLYIDKIKSANPKLFKNKISPILKKHKLLD